MKKILSILTLLQLGTAGASVVAVMDTGTDISHKDLAVKAWVNKNEKVGSLTDLDGSGLPGDVNGWDFTENSAKVFNDKYNYLVTNDVKRFYSYMGKYDMGTLAQSELDWLRQATQNKALMNQVNFVGSYAHGTHVGGIAALNNPNAKVMSLKILPTVYRELPPENLQKEPVQLEFDFEPAMTVAEFKEEVIKSALSQIEEMIPLNGYLDFHKVDVVNQSFGIGFNQAVGFLHAGFVDSVKRAPTQEELIEMILAYFGTMRQSGPRMFSAAPNTLFVIAAGNDNSNNDALPDYPADIQAANKLVVAATKGYSALADFSNYGAKKVDVAAPGVAINSTSPANSYLAMSGTSQAAPFVTNAIALAKDKNPALGAADLRRIIMGTVDVKEWLKDKVLTSGIVNKARVLKAAELSKTMNVELAISKARAEIADVAEIKSFNNKRLLPALNFKPLRPSLLIKLP